jgi:hypothetical protein
MFWFDTIQVDFKKTLNIEHPTPNNEDFVLHPFNPSPINQSTHLPATAKPKPSRQVNTSTYHPII